MDHGADNLFGFGALAAIVLIVGLLVTQRGEAGENRSYSPVKVKTIPGIRFIADQVRAALVKPYLAEAGGDSLFASDLGSESVDGASNYATALGNGRLSVEISPWADLTVFRWPNPINSDQLRYITEHNQIITFKAKPVRMGMDAPGADWRRYSHPIETYPDLGSQGGVLLKSGELYWTSDPVWTTERGFAPEDSTILVTRMTGPQVSMEVADWLDPVRDLMVRSFKIKGPGTKFFYHATFAPWISESGHHNETDPKDAGFAAVYLADDQIVLHFQPKAKDKARAQKNIQPGISAAELDQTFPEGGVFIAWGFMQKAAGFQVGADLNGAKMHAHQSDLPQAGKLDARDGSLSGSDFHLGLVDAALSAEISPEAESTVTVLIAASNSAVQAVRMINEARKTGKDALQKTAADVWHEVSNRIHLPELDDPVTARVIRRSVLNLVQGQDKESGAIVASISRQPHYHFDWPRDGSFFDLTLDLAGLTDKVTKHHQFYKQTQYTEARAFGWAWILNYRSPWWKPAGHWPSNMDLQGKSGSIPARTMPFEIDETSLLVWDFWRHERSLPEAERQSYIGMMKDTMVKAADAMLNYVDLKKGWTRPAIEDDNFPPDATLHGVASVLTGLAAACDAGPRWGVDRQKVDKWCSAARTLREGTRARITDPKIAEVAGWRGLAWSIWPAPVFDNYDEPGAKMIKEKLAQSIREKVEKQRPGFAYLGEEIFILALADRERGEYRDLLKRGLTLLTHEVGFPGTDCYGEVTLWGDYAGTGQKVAQQRTSIPHIWNGVTVYLSALAIYEPQVFDPMKPPKP